MCRYDTICRYMSVSLGIVWGSQNNTYIYLQIPTIPTHSDILAHTYNSYTYLQYLHIVINPQIPTIPTNTFNTYWYLHIPTNNDIPTHTYLYLQYLLIPVDTDIYFIHAYTYQYLQYLHIATNTYDTCIYLCILDYTAWYWLIHHDTCWYMLIPHTPNLEPPYLGNQSSVWHEPKSRCNNHPFTTNCAGWWYMECIRRNLRACWKFVKGVNLGGPQHLKCASDFSSGRVSCTMRVEGRASQVSAFLDHPGRFYVCGKMDLNTKLFEGVMFDAPSSHE